jgi:hypothetical protein
MKTEELVRMGGTVRKKKVPTKKTEEKGPEQEPLVIEIPVIRDDDGRNAKALVVLAAAIKNIPKDERLQIDHWEHDVVREKDVKLGIPLITKIKSKAFYK